ncbi:hypothetical protein BJD12_16425 [Xanthomonas vesicatoria ATCC 35937]|nr:hypothetical protein BI313_19355 [Xanthomonas vesicatoria]APP76544.1 hypothetical protein BJD12_16425 [Xanthomonas vesicatoria ATCC 35937]
MRPRCTPTSSRVLATHRRGTFGGKDAAKELHGRTCSVSRDGGRTRALQRTRRSVVATLHPPADMSTAHSFDAACSS